MTPPASAAQIWARWLLPDPSGPVSASFPEGQSRQPEVQARYDAHTQAAIDAGVFGAPTWVVDGELFWGQDRLEFVARKLGF